VSLSIRLRENQIRQFHLTGRYDCTKIQVALSTVRLVSNGVGSVSACDAKVAYERGTSTVPFTWSGSETRAIPATTTMVLSDVLNVTIPGNTAFNIRQDRQIASTTLNFADNDATYIAPTYGYVSPIDAANPQGFKNGALTVPTGVAAAGFGSVACILGVPTTKQASLILIGDSIMNGLKDSNRGAWVSATVNVNGRPLPFMRQSVSGIRMFDFANSLSFLTPYWPYATHIVVEPGTNDIILGRTYAQLTASATSVFNAIKAVIGPYGIAPKISACTILPNTLSTSGLWNSDGDQYAYVAGFEPGGIAETYNTVFLPACLAAGLIDKIVDTRSAVASATDSPSGDIAVHLALMTGCTHF